MADLNKLFPGFESFMDGDIEINNEVTVPESDDTTAESVADEVESEEIATEGAEIEGEAAENETAAEATNMMFDHLLMMYHHVKRFGIDRTFLSLYNNKGQLNNMIGYRFPSCESIDSVGSPRSQMSAAFIAAMEDEQGGVFTKIWNWIKAQCAKIYNFVLKIIEWFKDKFINTGARIEKLKKVLNNCTFKSADEIDDNLTAADAGKILDVLKTSAAKSIAKAIADATKEAAATAKKLEAEMADKNVNELKDTSGLSQDVGDSKAVAGKPYVIKFNDDVENPVLKYVTIKAEAPETIEAGNCTMTGLFNPYEFTESDKSVFFLISGNRFSFMNEPGTIKGLRAYFTLNGIEPDMYSKILFNFGEVDGIRTVNMSELGDEMIYDLQGRKLNNSPQKGVYIKNGHKYVK